MKAAKADFVTFGPVFNSPGKGPALGLGMLREAAALGPYVYALGGVNWDNGDECIRHGAIGVAGIRLFRDPEL